MTEQEMRQQIVDTGKELLQSGLVARTWGNVSCRRSEDSFFVSPSGLDYAITTPADIVLCRGDGTWEGMRKPSGERGVHAAAYEMFPDVNFVIHTHQTYATALGLAGWESFRLSGEETAALGTVAWSDYGLPGQKKLWENVRAAMAAGAKTILMAHHGALLCGRDKEDAMAKALLLEEICKRHVLIPEMDKMAPDDVKTIMDPLTARFPTVKLCESDAVLTCTDAPMKALLDDMAQMIGRTISICSADANKIAAVLEKKNAVLVPGLGAVVRGENEDDSHALTVLVHKAAVAQCHCENHGVKALLPLLDCALMRFVYKTKYSKQKKG